MLGQPTRVGRLVVTPLRVAEDSRCPINARCVWAGRAVVQTRIDGPGWLTDRRYSASVHDGEVMASTFNVEYGRDLFYRASDKPRN